MQKLPKSRDEKVINLYKVISFKAFYKPDIQSKGMSYGSLDQRDEKVICLSSNFRGRQTHIVAYRGAVCNQKGSPRVHWIYGGLHAKYQEMRKI